METVPPAPVQAKPGEMPQVPAPFLANMGLAQIQALGLLGYLPPFPPMNFMPPGLNNNMPQVPLDLSKSGYESMAQGPLVIDSGVGTNIQDQDEMDMDMDTESSGEQRTHSPSSQHSPQSDSSLQSDPAKDRKPIQERVRQKRQTLQDMTRPLKHWLYHHRENPYPSKSDKVQLARSSQMTMTQVSNWFANARRRLKNTVRGSELTWAKRIKLYNNFVEGNQELLSVGSSSSDDDLTCELTPTDADREIEQDNESRVQQQQVQERVGEQCHQEEISDTSALSNQGACKEDNLQDRLRGDSYSVPTFAPQLQAFDSQTSPLLTFSTISQAYSQSNNTTMPTADNNVTSQHVMPQQTTQNTELHTAHARVNSISGFGEGEGMLQEGSDGHPKYKHTIMQRYLNDSYNSYQNALLSLNSPVSKDPKEKERHRNPSGSLSSHDYEEYMSSASSARSTPTREHQAEGHVDEYEEFSRHWPDIKTRAEDDLYWKEISAALALTSLARSRYPAQTQYATTPSTD